MERIEQIPILFLRASRNFPNVKTRNEKKDLGDNSIHLFWEADGQDLEFFFEVSKVYSYPTLLF